MVETKEKAASSPVSAPVVETERKVKLSRPLELHGGTVSEITLKEPGAGLVLKHGLPWKEIITPTEDGTGAKSFEVEFLPAKMGMYLEAMAGVDQLSLAAMPARDMTACFGAVYQMLQPAKN